MIRLYYYYCCCFEVFEEDYRWLNPKHNVEFERRESKPHSNKPNATFQNYRFADIAILTHIKKNCRFPLTQLFTQETLTSAIIAVCFTEICIDVSTPPCAGIRKEANQAAFGQTKRIVLSRWESSRWFKFKPTGNRIYISCDIALHRRINKCYIYSC